MNTAKRYTMVALATAAVALPLIGAGVAHASEDDGAAPAGPSTESPTQGVSAVQGTLENGNFGLMDALNAASGNAGAPAPTASRRGSRQPTRGTSRGPSGDS